MLNKIRTHLKPKDWRIISSSSSTWNGDVFLMCISIWNSLAFTRRVFFKIFSSLCIDIFYVSMCTPAHAYLHECISMCVCLCIYVPIWLIIKIYMYLYVLCVCVYATTDLFLSLSFRLFNSLERIFRWYSNVFLIGHVIKSS